MYSRRAKIQSITFTLLVRKGGIDFTIDCEIRPCPFFFFRLPSNAFPDIGSVGGIEKKNLKKGP